MGNLSLTAKRIIFSILGILATTAVIGVLLDLYGKPFEKPLPLIIGLIAGGSISILKVIMLEKSMVKSIDSTAEDAANYARIQFVLRYAVTIVLLAAVVFFRQYVGLWGAIVGILSLQFGAYIASIINRKNPEPPAPQAAAKAPISAQESSSSPSYSEEDEEDDFIYQDPSDTKKPFWDQ